MKRNILLGTTLLLAGMSLQAQDSLTNREIWYSRTFSTEYVSGLESMLDGEHYTTLEETADGVPAIQRYRYQDGALAGTIVTLTDLVAGGAPEGLSIQGYQFSPDERKLLIETDIDPLYRYSYYARYWMYDREARRCVALSDTTGPLQRLATISPAGTHAAFVRDNDLYVVDLNSMAETRITHDGAWNKVLNGATDWVYEEEFALVQGYAWSPKGTKLLYLRSDESQVKEFDLTYYRGQLYPEEYRFKYPKAGEENSQVGLFVYDLQATTTREIPVGEGGPNEDFYLPRFGWTPDDATLWFMRLDRLQQQKTIYTLELPAMQPTRIGLKPKAVYQETSATYVEVTDDLHFHPDGSGFVLTSEKSGWNHVYWVTLKTGVERAITAGEYDVLSVAGIDAQGKRVIFTASMKGATRQEVWAVGLNGKGLKELSPEGGVNEAEFSEGFRYFINIRSTANEPPVTTLHDGRGRLVKTLKDNAKLREQVARFGWRPKEFLSVPGAADGLQLNAWRITPPGFDSRRAWPVLVTQYSGPNSNEVLDQWGGRNDLWHQLMAQRGYVVVCVDPRGTGHRGRDFRHVTYGQLGKYETEDMIAAASWLGQQPWVDASRIGIWGWSYGGYMSSLCITKGADVFKAAVAVAPVTNWRYYDTIYTERYMGLPKDNGDGYDDNSPINHVAKLKGAYLLVHGTADDNVHYQNAAEMVNSLVRANKPFEQFAYPDKNHGIYGGTTRLHLFEMLTDWFQENL